MGIWVFLKGDGYSMRYSKCWIRLLISSIFFVCEVSFSMDDFVAKLATALDKKTGFSVLTITRCSEIVAIDGNKATYATFKPLDKTCIQNILRETGEKLKLVPPDYPVFVVFNEYFFSRELLSFAMHNEITEVIKQFSLSCPNAIFYVNSLHEIEHPIPKYDDWRIYSTAIHDLFPEMPIGYRSWDVSFCGNTIATDGSKAFTNETFVVFLGNVISTYRKSTYYKEADEKLTGTNANPLSYLYGFGSDEIVPGLEGIHKRVAEILHARVYSDICWDVAQHIRVLVGRIVNSDVSQKALTIAEPALKLQQLLKKAYMPLENFKLHIIQSDSVNLHSCINDFPNGQTLVHSDSRTFSCSTIMYPHQLNSIIKQLTDFVDQNRRAAAGAPDRRLAINAKINTALMTMDDEIKRNFISILHTHPGNASLIEVRCNDDTPIKIWFSLSGV
jgi:hypothetical protein